MKKLLLILTMLVMMLPSMCFADPVIKSDSRTFNPLTGVYDLQGNVVATVTAEEARYGGERMMKELLRTERMRSQLSG